MRNATVVGEDGGRGRALRECAERDRGRDWRKRIKPFFFGTVGERESDTTCVEVLRRRIAERGGSFISSGPLSYSLLVWKEN
jgi:hypothetical protein